MIETLARAAHRAELALNGEKNETVIEIDWELHGWRYIEGQKAALKALETPTPAMIEAGLRVVQYYAHEGRAMSDEWLVSSIHEAMIRAASVEDET